MTVTAITSTSIPMADSLDAEGACLSAKATWMKPSTKATDGGAWMTSNAV